MLDLWRSRVRVVLPAMLAILLLFRIFISMSVGRDRFRRWYGVPLVGMYVAYTVLQYVLS